MFRYDRLDELIAETGKKKNYLSQKMGHAARYLNDAKKQNTNIKIEEVIILAQELGVNAEYLTGETDEKKTSNPEVGGLRYGTMYNKLSPEEQAAVNVMIETLYKRRSDGE